MYLIFILSLISQRTIYFKEPKGLISLDKVCFKKLGVWLGLAHAHNPPISEKSKDMYSWGSDWLHQIRKLLKDIKRKTFKRNKF